MVATAHKHYMAREPLQGRRHTWRQKAVIHDRDSGRHVFFVDFGEYADGRLGEVFITSQKTGTFVRGTLDALARCVSLALQSGTSPHEVARTLCGMDYPPAGTVEAPGSTVVECLSIADYLGQEIYASYGEDGKRKEYADAEATGMSDSDYPPSE